MFDHIKVDCSGGEIRISWEWNDPKLTGVTIYYKKSGTDISRGALFSTTNIAKISGVATGLARKKYMNESGLYTFTFAGITEKGMLPDIVVENVLLGTIKYASWEISRVKEGIMIHIIDCEQEIPEDLIFMEYRGYKMPLHYPVKTGTELLISNKEISISDCALKVKEPYDRIYRLNRK